MNRETFGVSLLSPLPAPPPQAQDPSARLRTRTDVLVVCRLRQQ